MSEQPPNEFEKAGEQPERGIVREFWSFLLENKKFWLIPLLLALLALGAIVILGAKPATSPFIYTLF